MIAVGGFIYFLIQYHAPSRTIKYSEETHNTSDLADTFISIPISCSDAEGCTYVFTIIAFISLVLWSAFDIGEYHLGIVRKLTNCLYTFIKPIFEI